MYIRKIKIEGFKTFRKFKLDLNKHLNIIVGDNETGKTTLLEAINLILSCQLDGHNIQYELNPYIFNADKVRDFFNDFKEARNPYPPQILIEAYLDDDESSEIAKLRGTNNSEGENCPGLKLCVELNEGFATEFMEYFKTTENPEIIPIEYYKVIWNDFGGNPVAARNLPFRAKIIDTSLVRGYLGPNDLTPENCTIAD
ncbi:MAG: DUF2813 domain-containing protein [Alphaproteobacteria bacterium]|nr:MAG: DUF2813 domain-containing protein [Alphaproteobacteria bacterium]